MPRPKETEPLMKVKINLFATDYERLKSLYPLAGPARVIRALVHAHVARIGAKAPAASDLDLEMIEIDEGELDALTED